MESRSEHSQPEQQAWNTTYFTPQPQGGSAHTEAATQDAGLGSTASTNVALCLSVREQLQSLLENDGSVRPEAATALYGHLAVCSDCAREFEAMQRVVHMLEALPMAALPADYSRLVMHRIQTGYNPEMKPATVPVEGLCDRVRERLQPLLDDDLAIGSQMASLLHGHIAHCPQCTAEFYGMRRLVNLLETMPSATLPIDYSPQIMRRIHAGEFHDAAIREPTTPGPTFAASSLVFEGAATHETRAAVRPLPAATLSVARPEHTRQSVLQRMLLSVGLFGLFVYLLASEWGRQMLGVTVDAAHIWLSQIGELLQQVPLLSALIVGLTAALASINAAISQSFAALGGAATLTLAAEISLGLAACFLIGARRKTMLPNG